MAQVQVIAGPAGSGKTQRLLTEYRQALAEGPPGAAVWLAPTSRTVKDVRRQLLSADLRGCFQPGCLTFRQFAQAVLDASSERVLPLGDLPKRQLLRRLLDEAEKEGRLRYFGPIAQTEGIIDLLANFIRELKRLEIWPNEFRDAFKARGLSEKDRELADLYEAYQRLLTEHQLFDAEGRFWSARRLLRAGQTRPFEHLCVLVADGFTDFTRTQHEILEILAERAERIIISLPFEDAATPVSERGKQKTPRRGKADTAKNKDGLLFDLWEEEPKRPANTAARDELFDKTRATLAELHCRHRSLTVERLERRPVGVAALDHVERELFRNPRHACPAADATGIEILAASGQLGEIELVGQQIKRLVVDGNASGATGTASAGLPIAPGEIAVVFRSLADVAPLVREVFDELGIPYALESGRPLSEAPCLAALIGLLRLHLENWPFRQLLAALTNNYFDPDWPEFSAEAVTAAERLIRHLQIPRGGGDLVDRLTRWASAGDVPGGESPTEQAVNENSDRQRRALERRHDARLAAPLLAKLQQALSRLPKRGSPAQWTEALDQLAAEIKLLPAARDSTELPAAAGLDRAAWSLLLAALNESQRLATWLGESPPVWTLADVLKQIQDIQRTTCLPGNAEESGRVRVLSAPTARTIRVPYLFAAGLSERAFPPPDHEDTLYGEREAQRLIDSGLPWSSRQQRSAAEMLLFYEVVTRATKRLWLSYPALDDKAQPLLPSPFLAEIERVCGPGKIQRPTVADLSPLPRGEHPLSPAAFRLMGVSQGLAGKPQRLAGLIQSQRVADSVLSGLALTDERRRGDLFGPFEGMLRGDAARAKLAQRFGPLTCWSASQLEQYALCPHQFYLDRVLGLEPLEDLSLEIDYLSRGGLLHDALATLHRQLRETSAGRAVPSGMKPADFRRNYEEAVQACVEHIRTEGLLGDALREIDRRLLLEWGEKYFAQHREYDQAWSEFDEPLRPTYFEASFGPRRGDEPIDGISTETPFELATGDDTKIRLAGRVDRIDIGRLAGHLVFNLVDYKSGTSAKLDMAAIEAGLALQLPLYTLAVQELLLADQHALPWRVGYWRVKTTGFRDRDVLKPYDFEDGELGPTPEWRELVEKVRQRVAAFVRGIQAAEFPMHSADDKCTSRCSFRTVCRVHQVRALDKVWAPPAPAPTSAQTS